MSRGAYRQADLERAIRAAGNQGAIVQMDMRSLTLTIIPGAGRPVDKTANPERILVPGEYAPDGKENWDED